MTEPTPPLKTGNVDEQTSIDPNAGTVTGDVSGSPQQPSKVNVPELLIPADNL